MNTKQHSAGAGQTIAQSEETATRHSHAKIHDWITCEVDTSSAMIDGFHSDSELQFILQGLLRRKDELFTELAFFQSTEWGALSDPREYDKIVESLLKGDLAMLFVELKTCVDLITSLGLAAASDLNIALNIYHTAKKP